MVREGGLGGQFENRHVVTAGQLAHGDLRHSQGLFKRVGAILLQTAQDDGPFGRIR